MTIKNNKDKANKKPARHSLYANLKRKKSPSTKATRQKAKDISNIPKDPVRRFFWNFHPKRVKNFIFSKQGGFFILKALGVMLLIGVLFIGGLFAYFRKDLDTLRPEEVAKRVQTTVNVYLDRNGELLWEDKGDGNYRLAVKSEELSDNLKNATIAVEDKDFYKHGGFSLSALSRAFINNMRGGKVQGGSTLTQQLVKQVFFSEEAANRSLSGVPRKIKEVILSIELERMYDKDQILTLYLNESPYGGRRNGAESGARTYFGKSAKDLTVAEAALLAAIPNSPSLYDPYNVKGHEALIARQHHVLNRMVEEGFITREEADEAKAYPIIDNIIPASSQYANIKAPHFIQMVKSDLEKELGKTTVGRGGLTIKTTLDLRIQNKLEESMDNLFNSGLPNQAGFSNGASTVEESQTGQIIALMGSRDFNYPGFGQDNAATAYIQPGSTIKPFVYAKAFEKNEGKPTFGTGSIVVDNNIDALYGAKVNNADNRFKGPMTMRNGLAQSRNIPAIKTMYINGVPETIDYIQEAGAKSYCTQGSDKQAGLASAIGGCGVRQVDLVNAYATMSRQGIYKPQVTILEVKDTNGTVIKKWADTEGKRVMSAQVTYMISDVLSDPQARAPLYGAYPQGVYLDGIRSSAKTGTSDKGGKAKDIWMVSYSPVLVMGVWLGNPDTSILRNASSIITGRVVAPVMQYAHKEIYAKEGKWKPGDWYEFPDGLQKIGNELYPSWWNKNQGQTEQKMRFNRINKKKATDCTIPEAVIEISVMKSKDPITKKDVFISPDGYLIDQDDDCSLTPGGVTLNVTASQITGTVTGSIQPVSIEIYHNNNLRNTVSGTSINQSIAGEPGDTVYAKLIYENGTERKSQVYTIAGTPSNGNGGDSNSSGNNN